MIEIKMDEKGRILIPKEIRDQLHFEPGETFKFKIESGNLIIIKSRTYEGFMTQLDHFQSKLQETTDKPISTDNLF